jgi:hypothetical protein
MHATGLSTTQPAYNRDLLRILLAAVVLAFIVTVLIVTTAGRPGVASPTAAPAPNAITPSRVQFFADERGQAATSGNPGSVIRIQPDGRDAAPEALAPRSRPMIAD